MSSPLFDNGKANAWEQQMELFTTASAMLDNATPEWSAFLQLVREMRKAQRRAESGVPHSQKQRQSAEEPVDRLLSEIEQVRATPLLDFNKLEGGAA